MLRDPDLGGDDVEGRRDGEVGEAGVAVAAEDRHGVRVEEGLGRAYALEDDVVDLDPERSIGEAAALADDVGLEQAIADRSHELDEEAQADAVADVDLRVSALGGPLAQDVAALRSQLELRLGGRDLDEARAHRHRRVDGDREVLSGAEHRLVALDKDRRVEVAELGRGEGRAVEAQVDVVAVDEEVDPLGVAEDGRLDEQEHVVLGDRELELAQLLAGLLGVEAELAAGVERRVSVEVGHEIVEGRHR